MNILVQQLVLQQISCQSPVNSLIHSHKVEDSPTASKQYANWKDIRVGSLSRRVTSSKLQQSYQTCLTEYSNNASSSEERLDLLYKGLFSDTQLILC